MTRRFLFLLAAAALGLLPALPAAAEPGAPSAAAEPGTVTWTVQPATAAGPDGRRWIERTIDPGQRVTEHLAVRNLSAAAATFALRAADGYLTAKGRFTVLPSDRESVDGGAWITVAAQVTVPARQTRVVPFTITVPPGATPGDHPAGIAATIVSAAGTVRVESRVGFRVLLRASGVVRAAVAADSVEASYRTSWNPLRPGTLRLAYTVANSGNVRVDVHGRAEVSELSGASAADTGLGELLPGGSRAAETRVDGVWALGRLRTTLTLTPAVPGGSGAHAPTVLTTTTWAGPWPQLLLVVVVAMLVLTLRWARRRRRSRLAGLLEQARIEGRRSATAAG